MVIVKKYFKDSKDDLKPYNVGDEHDFGEERNKYLVDNGFADFVKQTKVLTVETKKKPISKRSKK